MVNKRHKYVTLLQINFPRVMILSQKLRKFISQGDIYLTVTDIYLRWRVIYLRGGTFIWQEGTFNLKRVTNLWQIIRMTRFWSCVRTLKDDPVSELTKMLTQFFLEGSICEKEKWNVFSSSQMECSSFRMRPLFWLLLLLVLLKKAKHFSVNKWSWE